MFVVRVIRHQLGTMAAALRALVALVVISSFAHIDAFSPAPALWGVGKSSVMGSRTLGRSGMRPRRAKMAVSQDVDQELKAKQEAEMKAILEGHLGKAQGRKSEGRRPDGALHDEAINEAAGPSLQVVLGHAGWGQFSRHSPPLVYLNQQ